MELVERQESLRWKVEVYHLQKAACGTQFMFVTHIMKQLRYPPTCPKSRAGLTKTPCLVESDSTSFSDNCPLWSQPGDSPSKLRCKQFPNFRKVLHVCSNHAEIPKRQPIKSLSTSLTAYDRKKIKKEKGVAENGFDPLPSGL